MNGLRPPLTAPPGFAVRQSRSDSKECCRPALLFREGEFPWQTRKPIKNISSAGTTPLARLLSAVPDSVRPCRNYVELHIILLYFPAFCDTILILINFTAENSRWNINIFAKVFPAKSPQIHPTISEFAEIDQWQIDSDNSILFVQTAAFPPVESGREWLTFLPWSEEGRSPEKRTTCTTGHAPNIKRLPAQQPAAVLSCTQPYPQNRGKPT